MAIEELDDEKLRSILSEYMDDVPPVTSTTRNILLAKLKKFQSTNEPEPETIGEDHLHPFHFELLQSKQPMFHDGTESHKWDSLHQNPDIDMCTPSSTNEPIVQLETINSIFSSESSHRNRSPVLDYASRMPNYRRRSIHPDRPDMSSPYSAYVSDDSPISGSDMRRSRAFTSPLRTAARMNPSTLSLSTGLGFIRRSTNNMFLWMYCSLSAKLAALARTYQSSKIALRWIFFLLLVSLLIYLLVAMLIGDPFYRNPIEDVRPFLQTHKS